MDLSICLISTIFLFGIMVTQSHSSLNSLCFDKPGLEPKPYDNKLSICCDGEVKRLVRDLACCAKTTTYFISTHLCCGGQVVDRYHPQEGNILTRHCSSDNEFCREHVCCGNKTVDKLSSLCCQNTHVFMLNQTQILERDSLQCCGATVINKTTHFCCGNSSFPINSSIACCGSRDYHKYDHKCLRRFNPPRVVKIYEEYCSNSTYDTRKNSCCSGVLNTMPQRDPTNSAVRNQHHACCDSIVYDNTKNKCCRGRETRFTTHIIPNETTVHCCGDGWYNSTHQDCYNGTVLEKIPGMIRCAYDYIDGVREKCCGDVSYNPNSHQCCMGNQTNIIPKHMVCCNGEGVDDNQLCCGEIKRSNKRHPDDDECCYSSRTRNGTTYNSRKNEYCVDEEVMLVPPEAEPCSRSNYYYPTTQICCNDRVENRNSGYDHCCGSKPYKSISQQCCDNEVSNIPPTEGSCCLMDAKVYRSEDAHNPCMDACGNKQYHAVTHVCCSGTVHVRHENTECCGTSSINSTTTRCCGELFPYSRSGNTRCCGDRELFDNRHFKCQHNKIVPQNSAEKRQPDVQQLCNNMALLHFDGAISYACESKHVVQGRLIQVLIHKDINPEKIYIRLSLVDVRNVNRGANFTALSGQKNLNFTIEVPNTNGVTCRKRYLDRCCNVFVFFSEEVKNGHVTISPDSTFFMAKYNRKRENMIKKHLTYQYCIDKFDVGKKIP